MIDIKKFRTNPDIYKESCRLRWVEFDFSYFLSLLEELKEFSTKINWLLSRKNLLTKGYIENKTDLDLLKDIKSQIKKIQESYDLSYDKYTFAVPKIPLPIDKTFDKNKEYISDIKCSTKSIDYLTVLKNRWWIDDSDELFSKTYKELALFWNFLISWIWEYFSKKWFIIVNSSGDFLKDIPLKKKILLADDLPIRYLIIEKFWWNINVKLLSFTKPQDNTKEFEMYHSILKDLYTDLWMPFKIVLVPYQDMKSSSCCSYYVQVYCPYDNSYCNIWDLENNLEYICCDNNIKFKGSSTNDYLYSVMSSVFDYKKMLIYMVQNYVRDDFRLLLPDKLSIGFWRSVL